MTWITSAIDREWFVSCPRCGKSYYSSVARCEVCNNSLQVPVTKTQVPRPTVVQQEYYPLQDVEYAGFLIRVLAYLMDQVMVWLTLVMLGLIGYIAIETGAFLVGFSSEELRLMFSPLIFTCCLATYAIYYTFYHGYYGQTLGKILLGLKVIRTNGEDLSYSVAFKRFLGYFASSFFFGFGYLMPIFTKRRQALHDKIADTVVIKI